MVAKRPILAAFALICVLLPVVAADGSDRHDAQVGLHYTQAGSLDGATTGSLDVHRILFPGGPSGELVIDADEARFLHVVTKVNVTRVGDHGFVNDYEPLDQRRIWSTLEGELRIVWPEANEHSLLLVAGPDYLNAGAATLRVDVATEGAQWSAPRTGSASDSRYGVDYRTPGEQGTTWGVVPVPHRWATLADPEPAHLDGAFMLHLRQARLTVDGDPVWDRAPYGRTETVVAAPVGDVRRTQTTFTDGFLFVDAGSATLPLEAAQISVADADWQVSGDAVFHGASGRYALGAFNGTFHGETLGLSGLIELHETLDDGSGTVDGRGAVHGTATGSFAVIAVDHVVRASGPVGMTFLQQAVWITLLAGALGLAWWLLQHAWVFLYSRVKEDEVLDHPKRADIMRLLAESPGCHIERVARDLGLARGVARHHLMVLERAGQVRRYREAGHTLLVPAGHTRATALRATAMEDVRLAYIHTVVQASRVRRAELVAMVSARHAVADTTARRWIDKATRMGLITEEGSGHSVTYKGGS